VFPAEAGVSDVVSAVFAGKAGVFNISVADVSGVCTTVSCIAGDIGLTGFNGLLMLVTLVALFTHVSCVVIQSLHIGSLYGVAQLDILFSVIAPM
jgi:hypothetical protein